jgi:hypothetical protein
VFSTSSRSITDKALLILLNELCDFFEVSTQDLIRTFIKGQDVSEQQTFSLDF